MITRGNAPVLPVEKVTRHLDSVLPVEKDIIAQLHIVIVESDMRVEKASNQ